MYQLSFVYWLGRWVCRYFWYTASLCLIFGALFGGLRCRGILRNSRYIVEGTLWNGMRFLGCKL